MIERPDEPGIWTREGKFYRVWHDGRADMIQEVIVRSGFLGDQHFLEHATAGDWHNLTAPATNAEAREKFHGWLKGHCNQSSDEQIADKAAEIFTGVEYVPIEKYRIAVKQIEDLETQVHHISDRRILAITTNWPATNNRRAELIERKVARTITPDETAELSRLQSYASARQNLFGPLPTEELEAQLVDLQAAEITTLKATVAKLEEQIATEHAKYINSERAATVALQAQTILKQAEKIAELKRERNNFANAADHLSADANRFQGSLQKLRDIAMSHGWDEGWTHGDLGAWLDQQLSEVPQQPEVIEGKGQAVTEEWCESIGGLPGDEVPIEMAFTLWEKGESERDGHDKSPHMHLVWSSIDSALFLETYDQHGKTLAAIELPVEAMQENVLAILKALGQKIEPRPAFVAPPKPEQVLIRYGGMTCWAIRDGDWYRRIGITGGMSSGLCELIDEKTGEPIKEQA